MNLSNDIYYHKYLKYKTKYVEMIGGGECKQFKKEGLWDKCSALRELKKDTLYLSYLLYIKIIKMNLGDNYKKEIEGKQKEINLYNFLEKIIIEYNNIFMEMENINKDFKKKLLKKVKKIDLSKMDLSEIKSNDIIIKLFTNFNNLVKNEEVNDEQIENEKKKINDFINSIELYIFKNDYKNDYNIYEGKNEFILIKKNDNSLYGFENDKYELSKYSDQTKNSYGIRDDAEPINDKLKWDDNILLLEKSDGFYYYDFKERKYKKKAPKLPELPKILPPIVPKRQPEVKLKKKKKFKNKFPRQV